MTVRVVAKYIKSRYTARRHKPNKPPFIARKPYLVHGFDHDDEGNGYVILVNEYKELFWCDNKTVRVILEK